LQNKLSKVEPKQAIRKDIQQDDKMLASNYDKHIEDAKFSQHTTRKNGQAIVRLGGCSRRN
jgi:ATP-binding cassette subfamily F protein 3